MLFGSDKAMPSDVQTDMIRVRALEPEEIRNLAGTQLVYVKSRDFEPLILVPAYVKSNLETYMQGSSPSVPVRDIYNHEFHVDVDSVFEADDLGEEAPVIRTVGSCLNSALFFLGVDPKEAEERLKKALRSEFGPGVVEVWNVRSVPVKDGRWDVYEYRTAWVPDETPSGRGKSKRSGSFQPVERRLLARGVRDGHQHRFEGKQTPGWSVMFEPHQADTSAIEVL